MPFVSCTLFALYFSFLAKRGVKEDIQTFDARKISPEIRKNVEDLMRKSKDSFEPAVSLDNKFKSPFESKAENL